MNTIKDIVAQKQDEVNRRKQSKPQKVLAIEAELKPPPRNFLAALKSPGVSLIAEVRTLSTEERMPPDFDPVALARTYENSGAAAISVGIGRQFFSGGLDDEAFRAIRQVVNLPVLYKDFVVDLYQVYEARAAGADAVLLIVAALDDAVMYNLYALARHLGMAVLVEVHTLPELRRGLGLHPGLMSISSRGLPMAQVSSDTFVDLRSRLPSRVVVVAEGEVYTSDDVARLARLKVDAMLVGEALVHGEHTAEKVRSLVMGQEQQTQS